MAAAFMRSLPWIILSKISKRFDDEEDKDFGNRRHYCRQGGL